MLADYHRPKNEKQIPHPAKTAGFRMTKQEQEEEHRLKPVSWSGRAGPFVAQGEVEAGATGKGESGFRLVMGNCRQKKERSPKGALFSENIVRTITTIRDERGKANVASGASGAT